MDELTRTSTNIEPNRTDYQQPPSSAQVANEKQQFDTRKPIDFRLQITDSTNHTIKPESAETIDSLRQKLSGSSKSESTLFKVPSFLSNFTKQITRKAKGQQVIEVLQVANICQTNPILFHWGGIDTPGTDDAINGYKIVVSGWILGKTSQPQLVQFLVNRTLIAETPINVARPDVVKVHFTKHINCGFKAVVDLEDMPNKAEILAIVAFSEGDIATIGKIKYCKYG